MDAPKLKPCPFCGEKAKLQEWENDGQTEQYTGIICLCGAEISGSVHWSGCDMLDVQSRSVAAWNRRTAPVTVEMLERWIAYAEDGLVSTPIKEMRAAIAQMKEPT